MSSESVSRARRQRKWAIDLTMPDHYRLDCPQIAAARAEDTVPCKYRLARKKDVELVLQGGYMWYEGAERGIEWRDIPTVDL